MGLPHAIAVTTADVTDWDGAIQTIRLNLDNLSHVEKFLVDASYSGQRFANQVKVICGAQVEVVKRSELHKFIVSANSLSLLRSLLFPLLPSLFEDLKQTLTALELLHHARMEWAVETMH